MNLMVKVMERERERQTEECWVHLVGLDPNPYRDAQQTDSDRKNEMEMEMENDGRVNRRDR